MPLTYGFESIRDLFGKLQRDAAALKAEVTSDSLFNFVVTGYSMIDWVKNDESVPVEAKQQQVLATLRTHLFLRVCGDLATAAKHVVLTTRKPVTQSASSQFGFGVGGFGKGNFGVGEESIQIELKDGTVMSALDLVAGVLEKWEEFFAEYGI